MPHHSVTVRCPTPSSFAVDQVRGMFDLAPADEASETFDVELPERGELIDDKAWQIGVIVGPSGSGKSTVARDVYGEAFCEHVDWDPTRAVVEQFDCAKMKSIVGVLNAVGFSSPPAWVKPHHVLSGGERFRCDLARALLSPGGLTVFDEFTSVVDRTVAKIGSAAIAKSLRKGRLQKQFVAVTCHYDVLDWLEPDWVLDMASGQLARGRLWQRGKRKGERRWSRPAIELKIAPVHRSAWHLFRRHHYLNHDIASGAKCFAAFWPQADGTSQPVAFSAWLHRMTRNRRQQDMREHRTVVLPDFQGVGIGNRLSELCASVWTGLGGRAFSTTSHPAMIAHRHASCDWKTIRHGMVVQSKLSPAGSRSLTVIEKSRQNKIANSGRDALTSAGRITGGFQYVGPAMSSDQAHAWLSARPRVFLFSAKDQAVLNVVRDTGGTNAAGVARRTSLSRDQAAGTLARLVELGELDRFHVGTHVGYALPSDLGKSGN